MTKVIYDVPVSREVLSNAANPDDVISYLRLNAVKAMVRGAAERGDSVITLSLAPNELTRGEMEALHRYLNPDDYAVYRWSGETRA